MAAPAQTPLPDPPASLRVIQSYMRMAQDIERVNPVVAYWVRLYSTETALKIDKESQESKTFLVALLSWLEVFKQAHKDDETVTNQTVGQAHYENFVMVLFNKADTLDREGTANKSTVRMFFMASILFEAMAVFGPLTEEVIQRAKYAKFKAAYIQKCLKTGQTPKPGPVEGADLEGSASDTNPSTENADSSGSLPTATGGNNYPQMPMPGNTDPISTSIAGSHASDETTKIGPPSKPSDVFILTPSVPPSKPASPAATPSPSSTMSQSNSTTVGGLSIADTRFSATNGAPLNPEDLLKGQKYCKFATSALQYDDIPTAVLNLQKALQLLTTGKNPD